MGRVFNDTYEDLYLIEKVFVLQKVFFKPVPYVYGGSFFKLWLFHRHVGIYIHQYLFLETSRSFKSGTCSRNVDQIYLLLLQACFFNHHKNSVIQPMSRYISSWSQIFNFIPILQSRCPQVFDNSCHFFSMLLISLFWLNLDSPYLFRKVIKSLMPEFSLLVSFLSL